MYLRTSVFAMLLGCSMAFVPSSRVQQTNQLNMVNEPSMDDRRSFVSKVRLLWIHYYIWVYIYQSSSNFYFFYFFRQDLQLQRAQVQGAHGHAEHGMRRSELDVTKVALLIDDSPMPQKALDKKEAQTYRRVIGHVRLKPPQSP